MNKRFKIFHSILEKIYEDNIYQQLVSQILNNNIILNNNYYSLIFQNTQFLIQHKMEHFKEMPNKKKCKNIKNDTTNKPKKYKN